MIHITFPDGAVREFEAGITAIEVAGTISSSLKKKTYAAVIDGELVDARMPIKKDCQIELVTPEHERIYEVYRHTVTHVMAQAVKRLYPETKLGVGPVIEDGFYYDMDIDTALVPADLEKVENEMRKIIKENLEIERLEVSRAEALAFFEKVGDPYKLELIRDLPEDEVITLYRQGEFTDLCRGPHLPSTGKIKAFKLQQISGAYWRGNSDNKMLQRIYGTAWLTEEELQQHLHFIEEAKARDHRKLGKELKLFMFSDEAPGMPFYLPNGMIIRTQLENFLRELQTEADYLEVRTPLMMNQRLWEQSGHWDHYHENMYFTEVDETKFALKPMNCPGHMLIYKNDLRSYRDLPIRMAEFGQVHRHELSGALNGMMRVRTFTQDDAHIYVRPDQIEEEIKKVIQLIDRLYGVYGFTYSVELSTRPENSMGSDELWEQAEKALQNVLEHLNMEYQLNEGDGAFYGPKIDFHIYDALKRSWQCATVQLDFQMPEKFDLTYIGEDNQRYRPVVIHRAVMGSIDRFIGVLTEHFAGAFPTWLAPVQVKILPVADKHIPYAKELEEQMKQAGIRVRSDERNEKLGYKIREAQMEKVPYMLIVGDKEVEEQSISLRKRGEGDVGSVKLEDLVAQILKEVKEKSL
ncbi:threonine--tRNA ligase [Rubeoparvulum massiliense]|uniref:threonine--tRNA ligase n=1 Tax=Rubeoparvulum massiliense TaxID=1631346 RepID=UPI00065DE0A1|nr:threonine--tRNA ligase [Rubeoparvulum massiliense]